MTAPLGSSRVPARAPRTFFYAEHVSGHAFEPNRNCLTMEPSGLEHFEDQHVQRAVQLIAIRCGRFHTSSAKGLAF